MYKSCHLFKSSIWMGHQSSNLTELALSRCWFLYKVRGKLLKVLIQNIALQCLTRSCCYLQGCCCLPDSTSIEISALTINIPYLFVPFCCQDIWLWSCLSLTKEYNANEHLDYAKESEIITNQYRALIIVNSISAHCTQHMSSNLYTI